MQVAEGLREIGGVGGPCGKRVCGSECHPVFAVSSSGVE
jgi:hypothetical protein